MKLFVSNDSFQLAQVFTISRGSRTQADVITVKLEDDGFAGYGECVPYARYNETMDSVNQQIESVRGAISDGMTRAELQSALPVGTARNALDCAMWDLEAKKGNTTVWQLAGLSEPQPVTTCFTLSLESPEKMLAAATKSKTMPMLKIKLGGDGDLERLQAVRQGAPDSQLVVDANEGWSVKDYLRLAPVMVDLGVALVEQPLPADNDDALKGIERSLPICADESCHDRASLEKLHGKYDFINIKLDKTGGLTEALALKAAATDAGFKIMVGCMVSTSLAMAPGVLVAQGAEVVDLDGPLLLAEDRDPAIEFEGALMSPAPRALWG